MKTTITLIQNNPFTIIHDQKLFIPELVLDKEGAKRIFLMESEGLITIKEIL